MPHVSLFPPNRKDDSTGRAGGRGPDSGGGGAPDTEDDGQALQSHRGAGADGEGLSQGPRAVHQGSGSALEK